MRKIIVGLFGFFAILLIVFVESDFRKISQPGYCGEINRGLSESELIELAVKREYPKIDFEEKYRSPEDGIRQFFGDHKNCCNVEREYENYFARMVDANYAWVNLYFKRNLKYSDPDGQKYYEAHVKISACGKIVSEYGTSIDKQDMKSGSN